MQNIVWKYSATIRDPESAGLLHFRMRVSDDNKIDQVTSFGNVPYTSE